MKAIIFGFFLLFAICYSSPLAHALPPKGVISLDTFTFDKVIQQYQGHVLVKFDKQYPFGAKEDEFKKFVERFNAQGYKKTSNILLTTVGVGEFGEKENDVLRQRFQLEFNQFPVYKLFAIGKSEQVIAQLDNSDITVDTLSTFITKHANIWMGLAGCLEHFDKLAQRYMTTVDNKDERSNIIKEAEQLQVTLTDEDEKDSAQAYVSIMKKLQEKDDFVEIENKRIDKLLKSKIAEKQKKKLNNRKNILIAFTKTVVADVNANAEKKDL